MSIHGLGHIGVLVGNDGDQNAMRFYNGLTAAEITSPYGLKKLGIEKLKPIFTRGVLLDISGYKGRMLDKGEEITLAEVQGAITKQGLADLKQDRPIPVPQERIGAVSQAACAMAGWSTRISAQYVGPGRRVIVDSHRRSSAAPSARGRWPDGRPALRRCPAGGG
jgi:hypothetical protein